jgi:hypothetical protein
VLVVVGITGGGELADQHPISAMRAAHRRFFIGRPSRRRRRRR